MSRCSGSIMRLAGVLLALPGASGAPAPATATAPASRPGEPIAAEVKAISPFLDPMTVMVARVDMTQVDVDAIVRQIDRYYARLDPALDGKPSEGLREQAATLKQFAGEFVAAGGRALYSITPLMDIESPLLVAPIAEKAQEESLLAVFRRLAAGRGDVNAPDSQAVGRAESPDSPYRMQTRAMRGAVVAGSATALERVQASMTGDWPLTEACRAMEGMPVQIVLSMSKEMRQFMLPIFAEGGGALGMPGTEAQTLLAHSSWTAIGIGLPPSPAVRIVVQTPGDEQARAVREALEAIVRAHGAARQAGPASARRAVEAEHRVWLGVLPEVKGDRLVRTLDARRIEGFLDDLAAAWREGLEQAGSR